MWLTKTIPAVCLDHMGNRRDIPYVKIPALWINSKIVLRKPNTRWYVQEGPSFLFRTWLKELNEGLKKNRSGTLIPMQWVPECVGVSRAAVHKRADRGGLTVFSYVIVEPNSTVLGKLLQSETRKQYDLVPFVECQAWREILVDIRDAREEFDDADSEE